MSVRVMSLVFNCNMPEIATKDNRVVPDTTAKSVLLALADHANDDGLGCYPSVLTLCHKTNYSTSTVCRALDALTDNGFIKPAGRSRRNTNDYSIIVEKVEEFQWSKRGNFDGRNDDISTVENKPSFNHQLTTLPVSENETEDKLSEEAEMDVEERKKSIERAMLRGIENHNEYSGFPEDVRPILKAFIDETGYNRILQKKGFLIKAVRDLAGVGVSAADIPKIIRIMKNKGLSHPYPSSLFTTALEYVEEKKNKPDRTVKGPRE